MDKKKEKNEKKSSNGKKWESIENAFEEVNKWSPWKRTLSSIGSDYKIKTSPGIEKIFKG
jgi:hypothetical protein